MKSPGWGVRSGKLWLPLLVGLLTIFSSVNAFAQGKAGSIDVEVTIAHLTDEPGKVDPRAARLDKELRGQFRYSGISVVSNRHYQLALDEIARDELPTGRKLMIKPILIEGKSALIAVDISGLVQTDLRLEDGQLVIIGAEKFKGGKLVIALEPHL